jgi:hypothetical protein
MSSVKKFNMLRLHGGHEKTLYDSWRWTSEPVRDAKFFLTIEGKKKWFCWNGTPIMPTMTEEL